MQGLHKIAVLKSCLLFLSIPQPDAHHLSPMCPLTQPSPCMKDMRTGHMGQEAGIQLKETVLAQQSALRPSLTCQLGSVHSLLGRSWPIEERTVPALWPLA